MGWNYFVLRDGLCTGAVVGEGLPFETVTNSFLYFSSTIYYE